VCCHVNKGLDFASARAGRVGLEEEIGVIVPISNNNTFA